MALINASYDVLSDPDRRQAHDRWIQRTEAQATTQERSSHSGQPPPHRPSQPPPPRPAPSRPSATKPPPRLKDDPPLVSHLKSTWGLYVLLIGGFLFYTQMEENNSRRKRYQSSAPPAASTSAPPADVDANRTPGILTLEEVYAGLNTDAPAQAQKQDRTAAPVYIRPATAPNGTPWPRRAAYVGSYPRLHDGGLSKVTIDNRQNDSDVFVKLVATDMPVAFPVRQFFIPSNSRFTLEDVTAGQYDVRYQDLNTGSLQRTETFDLVEIPIDGGRQFSEVTMTLHKTVDGNLQSYPISESEF